LNTYTLQVDLPLKHNHYKKSVQFAIAIVGHPSSVHTSQVNVIGSSILVG